MSAPLRILAMLALTGLLAVGLFALAGRWDWIRGWAYIAIVIAGNGINDLVLWRRNPELFRMRGRTGEGTAMWDKVCLGLVGLAILLILAVGALDGGRYQWSVMAPGLWLLGLALYAAGMAILTWAMVANRFFEKTVRIQKDRDQQVVDGGPYGYVRHPGYVGTILGFVFGSPFMLGSWWAFLPAFVAALVLVVRTVLEDRMLRKELDGYEAYATRVPYRLLPYLW